MGLNLGKDEIDTLRHKLAPHITDENLAVLLGEMEAQEFELFPTAGPLWSRMVMNHREGREFELTDQEFDQIVTGIVGIPAYNHMASNAATSSIATANDGGVNGSGKG